MVARIIASRACYTSSDLTGALLIGAAIGAGIALLYAPKSGRETREAIRDKATHFTEDMKHFAHEQGQHLRGLMGHRHGTMSGDFGSDTSSSGNRIAEFTTDEMEEPIYGRESIYATSTI